MVTTRLPHLKQAQQIHYHDILFDNLMKTGHETQSGKKGALNISMILSTKQNNQIITKSILSENQSELE